MKAALPITSAKIVIAAPGEPIHKAKLSAEFVMPESGGCGRLIGKARVVPIAQAEAFAFVHDHHRHHEPPAGWKFGLALERDTERGFGDSFRIEPTIVAVVVAGRPVAAALDGGRTLEVTRLCVWISQNAASMLYAAVCRKARELGYEKVITYTLVSESGASLRASGFTAVAKTRGGSWSRRGRPRSDKHPTCPKVRWERTIHPKAIRESRGQHGPLAAEASAFAHAPARELTACRGGARSAERRSFTSDTTCLGAGSIPPSSHTSPRQSERKSGASDRDLFSSGAAALIGGNNAATQVRARDEGHHEGLIGPQTDSPALQPPTARNRSAPAARARSLNGVNA